MGEREYCLCGCGELAAKGKQIKKGHSQNLKNLYNSPLCLCGCGERTKWCEKNKRYNKYILGHIGRVVFYKGMEFSEEHKKKIGEAHKGKTISDINKKRMSEIGKTLVGEKNPFYGKNHSKKTRKRLSSSAKERFKNLKTIQVGRVECILFIKK